MCFLPDQDVALISQELKSVSDWKGLASWLDMESNAIETDCAGEGSKAACYRRKLVRSYCDYQPSEDPYKVVEDIAVALEKMKHKRQAEKLRQLQFGKWVAKRNSPLGRPIGWSKNRHIYT